MPFLYIRYFRKREALTIWEWIQLVQRKQAWVKMAILGYLSPPPARSPAWAF